MLSRRLCALTTLILVAYSFAAAAAEGTGIVPATMLATRQVPVYIVNQHATSETSAVGFPAGVSIRRLVPGQANSVQVGGEPIRDADDLAVRYALTYDENGLAIFIDVRDDILRTASGASLWEGDSVQLVLDPGFERTDHYDENDLEVGFALQGKAKQSWSWTHGRPLTRDECQYDVRPTPGGYFVSARFPWSMLKPLKPADKGVFGFNLLVNDNDGGGRKGWLAIAPGIGRNKSSAENFVAILDTGRPAAALTVAPGKASAIVGTAYLYAPKRIEAQAVEIVAKASCGRQVNVLPPTRLQIPAAALAVIPFAFDAGELPPGPVILDCLLDGKSIATAQAQGLALAGALDAYDKLAAELERQVAELAAQGRPVRYLAGLLAIVRSQTRWARQNLADPDFDKFPLYRNNAIRRTHELAQVVKLLQEQIGQVRQGEKLDRFRTYKYVTSPVELRDGFYYGTTLDDAGHRGTRPILFNGFVQLVEEGLRVEPKELDRLYQMFETIGTPFIQYAGFGPYIWSYDKQHKLLDRVDGRWLYDPGVVASERVAENLKLAYKHNIAIDFLLSVENIYDHERDRYGLRPLNSGFLHTQINDPLAREGLGFYVRSVATDLKNSPHAQAILTFCLGNESIYIDTDLTDPQQQQAFVTYLKKAYGGDLATLNRAHQATYASFDDVINRLPKGPISYESPFPQPVGRLEYDWRQFKSGVFVDWFDYLAQTVRGAWPGALVGTKFMFFKSFSYGERFTNTPPEPLTNIHDINACDNYFAYRGGHLYMSPGYICDWLATAMHYDLLTSLKPVVVTNSENHIINDQETGDVPYDHVYTALFQQYMHGLGCSANWAWNDQRTGGYEALYGLFPIRPVAVAAASQASFDVNRLVYEIKAFFDARPRVAILYSPTSYLYNAKYGESAIKLYQALNFVGYKIGFLSEKQLQAGQFGKVKVLLAPNVSHVLPKTIAGLNAFRRAGGHVVSLGSSFVKDDFDRPLRSSVPVASQLDAGLPLPQLAKTLQAILCQRLGPLPVIVTTADGEIPDGVEWRCIPYKDGYLLNVVNYNFTPRKIEIRSLKGEPMELFDLIRYTPVPQSVELRPEFPLLLRVTLK